MKMIRGESPRLAMLHTALKYSDYVRIKEHFEAQQGTWRFVIPKLSSKFPQIGKAQCFTNLFVRLALRIIGGGADKLGHEASKTFRISGGEANVMRSLHAYVNTRDPEPCVLPDPVEMSDKLFGRNESLHLLTGLEMELIYHINPHTSAGIYQTKGVILRGKNRLGAVMQQIDSWRRIHEDWVASKLDPNKIPHIIWGLGTRGKLVHMDEIEDKIKARKPLCRTISVAEPIEHYLYFPLYHILSNILRVRLKEDSPIIMIGVKKKSEDWPNLCKLMESYDYVLCLDWSNFDASVPGFLLEYVWKILECAVKNNTINGDGERVGNYLYNCKLFYYNNFIKSIYVLRNAVITTLRGIPSGSLLTSIIGSVVNYILIQCVLNKNKYNISDVAIRVYGDDSVVCFNTKQREPLKFSDLIKDISETAREKFGMKINEKKTRICKGKQTRVGYRQPIYAEPSDILLQGTSDLRPIDYKYYSKPLIKYDYTRGLTHRFEYAFTNHPDFLMSYMDYLGRPINSVLHSIIRLVNPEMPVPTVSDAKMRIESCVFDNCYNINLRNYGFHLINALDLMVSKRDVLWHPMGIDIKAYRYKGIGERDDDEVLEDRARELDDLRLFYREEKRKIDFMEDDRTRYKLIEYEEHLRKLTGWNDMAIENERNPKPSQVRKTPESEPPDKINEYRPKGLYACKMLSYRDRNMGSLINSANEAYYSLGDYDHILLVVISYLKGYFKSKYTVWDMKDLPRDLLTQFDNTWYSDILIEATNDTINYQQKYIFQEPEYFSGRYERLKDDHELSIITKRALLMAQLWITTNVRTLETVMKEFYSAGVQDRAMEECPESFASNTPFGIVHQMCKMVNEMIEYRSLEKMYDILLHAGWMEIRKALIGKGCDLSDYTTDFHGKLLYVL